MPVFLFFLTLKFIKVKKLQMADKKHIMNKLFYLLIFNGYSLNEYLFIPASRINFKNVLILIDELEFEAGYESEQKFMFDNPQYEFFLNQK